MSAILREQVERVAEMRRRAAESAALVKELRARFDAEHMLDLTNARLHAESLAAAEEDLRAMVREHYAATQDKKPAPGVEVKTRATMAYEDAAALDWARKHGMALVPESLDRRAFEKIAKATRLDFVQYGEEPLVTIASDLDKALAVSVVTAAPTSEATP